MATPKCVADYDHLRQLAPPIGLPGPTPNLHLPACDYTFVSGYPDPQNSGLQGLFAWRPHSVDDDNGGIVIKPDALKTTDAGRWHRVFDGAISVKWFGAMGDGSTPDTEAIQAATDAAATAGGGWLFFPAGVYVITTTYQAESDWYGLIPKSNVSYLGPGTLKLANNQTDGATKNPCLFYLKDAALSNVTFYGLTFDMNATTNPLPSTGIWHNSAFIASWTRPADSNTVVNNLKFINNTFINHNGSNTILVWQPYPGGVLSNDVLIQGNRFYRMGLSTGDHSTINTFATNVRIVGNVFENLDTDVNPLYIATAFESHGSHSVFAANIVRNYLRGVAVSQNFAEDVVNNVVADNALEIAYTAVELSAATASAKATHNTTVTGNAIVFAQAATPPYRIGVNIFLSVPCKNLLVANNTIMRRQPLTDNIRALGIYQPEIPYAPDNRATGYLDGLQVRGNIFEGMSAAVDLRGDDSVVCWVRDGVIEDNEIRNCYDTGGAGSTGIALQGDNIHRLNVVVRNNKIYDNQPVSATGTGIRLGDYLGSFVLAGNEYRNVATPVMLSANLLIHAATKVIDDRGYVTENSGKTGAIASGSVVTHGLAGVPTSVVVAATEPGPTEVYVASVDADRFTVNFGGGGNKTFYWWATFKP